MARNFIRLSKEELEKTVKESKSFREVGKRFGITKSTAKREIEENNIDYSHFDFSHWGRFYDKLINKKVGMLTVESVYLKYIPHRKANGSYLHCVCECGKSKEIRADSLKRYYSCGCHAKNRWNMVGDKNPAFVGLGEIRGKYLSDVKKGAKRRGLAFNVTIKYLWDLYLKQDKKCALTGLPIYFGRIWIRHETTASLDRIDNTKGYVEGNLRWVLKDVNMIRADYDNEYFIKICNLIAKCHPR